MSGRIILDTNIIISLFNGDNDIYEYIIQADEIFIPSIAIGELYYGAHKSLNSRQNIRKINEFVKENIVMPCNAVTGMKYGEIKNSLKEKGKPIPENDIWIAAIAKEHSLVLITKDKHFKLIDDIKIIML